MQRPGAVAVVTAVVALVATGCSSDGGGEAPPWPGMESSSPARGASPSGSGSGTGSAAAKDPATPAPPPAKGSVTVESTLTEDLESPWGVTALPEGDLLVASRDRGTIVRVSAKDGKKTEVGEVPGVSPGGEGGLLGLALSPRFASDRQVYAYLTTQSDNRVVRMRYDERKSAGRRLSAPDTVLRGIPKGVIHNGGRIAFGPDKMLYIGTGEIGETGLAQDPKSLGGKILRMTPEGEPAPDNPEPGSLVYSLGHRNVQGLAWDAQGRLWAAEFGQNTWDELNLVRPGKNYGWPEVEGKGDDPRYVNPVAQWRTSEASPSGIAWAEGSIWMAGLRGERLWRIPLDGAELSAEPQPFLQKKHGRLRTVVAAGDSSLWLVTSETDTRGTPKAGDDRILRLRVT
ncbi:PQQ-dependent sugar dehydrogenase [Streptomyces sp. NPDC000594]|uniref:PQQ-dependent sugar dehydrogenase n=1 Tax=Streptomyces sp. NPDC000594 TaxID=3154261 RepID=UPI00332E04FB